MIQIDMEKPSACWGTDKENNIHSCPFLDSEYDCILQGHIGYWSFDGQYKNCPLHEVIADPDTVSRQAVIENVCTMLRNCFDASDEMIESVKITVGELPPSPSRPTAEKIQESYYSDNLVCSNCGVEARWDFEFCPYCGFKFKQTGGAV